VSDVLVDQTSRDKKFADLRPSFSSRFSSPHPLARRRTEKKSEKQLAADRARRRIVESDDEDDDAGSGASSQPTSTALKKKRALTASYLGAEVPSSSSSASGSGSQESEESSDDGGRGGRGKGGTIWERESDLDRDEEGFIVDEDEDEEGIKVVNEYRERVTVKAQGMMYFLKVNSDASPRRCRGARLTLSARTDLPSIPRPPHRLPSSRLACRRQRVQIRLRCHQRQPQRADAELDRFGGLEGEF
jgi:hypothetical protein